MLGDPRQDPELSPEGQPPAIVDLVGVRRTVNLSLLQDEGPRPGDWVLIHAGFALSKINEEDAEEQMRMLMLLGEDKAALEPVRVMGRTRRTPKTRLRTRKAAASDRIST